MLSVEPILERTLRTSGAGAVPGRAAVLEEVVVVVAAVEVAARGARGTAGFFSDTVPEVEDGVAGLAAVVRVREAVVVAAAPVLRVVVVLGLVESAAEVFRVLGFFSSPGLPFVLAARPRGFLAAVVVVVVVRVDNVVRTEVLLLLAAVVAVPFLVAAVGPV